MRNRRPWLTAAQQAAGIVAVWPDQPRPSVKRGMLRWRGSLQPTALSPAYTASLVYKQGEPPRVYIVEPLLDPGHRTALPHVYEEDRLCLYTPGEWTPTMSLARTILPWTSEWLFHYEVWRTVDHWVGGGHVHAPSDSTAEERALWSHAGSGP